MFKLIGTSCKQTLSLFYLQKSLHDHDMILNKYIKKSAKIYEPNIRHRTPSQSIDLYTYGESYGQYYCLKMG